MSVLPQPSSEPPGSTPDPGRDRVSVGPPIGRSAYATDAAIPQQAAAVTAVDVFGGGGNAMVNDLRTLVLSRHVAVSIETDEEERADRLLQSVAASLSIELFEWTVTRGITRPLDDAMIYDSRKPEQALAKIDRFVGNAIFVLKDFGRFLTQPEVSRAFRDLVESLASPASMSTLVLVSSDGELPREIESNVTRFDLRLPHRGEYEQVIYGVVESLALNRRAQVEITAADYPKLANALSGLTLNQARRVVAQVAIADGRLALDDLKAVTQLKASILQDGGLLEYLPADEIDVQMGGFASLRTWLKRQRMAFSGDARALNLPQPKGVMLVGVQGCGKSLAAKAIAREWELPLLRLDVGRLYDKFVGESERNFRRAIAISESLAPIVLWIDEIEKALTQGNGDADGGVGRRMFGAFLTWLQEKREGVFVVATANDIDSLPPEMLRKGRFDEIFFVDLPNAEERAEIFRIHLRFRRQNPDEFDIAALSAAADGFSGAEIEQVVVTTLLGGLQRRERPNTAAVLAAIAETVPLSRSRASDIGRLRATAGERFVSVR